MNLKATLLCLEPKYFILGEIGVYFSIELDGDDVLEKPPYVIPSLNAGFEIDLMQAVLSRLDHKISVVYVPYGRTYELMKQIKADIGLTLSAKSGVDSEILSQP